MKRIRNALAHCAVILGALGISLGIPVLLYGGSAINAADAVSGASVELPEQPSGNFVVLLNAARHHETAEQWRAFFSGEETGVIMDDASCLTAQGDEAGIQMAERFQARLAEHQMLVRRVNPTLAASRADVGSFDVVIVSEEWSDAMRLSTAFDREETAVIMITGE